MGTMEVEGRTLPKISTIEDKMKDEYEFAGDRCGSRSRDLQLTKSDMVRAHSMK